MIGRFIKFWSCLNFNTMSFIEKEIEFPLKWVVSDLSSISRFQVTDQNVAEKGANFCTGKMWSKPLKTNWQNYFLQWCSWFLQFQKEIINIKFVFSVFFFIDLMKEEAETCYEDDDQSWRPKTNKRISDKQNSLLFSDILILLPYLIVQMIML